MDFEPAGGEHIEEEANCAARKEKQEEALAALEAGEEAAVKAAASGGQVEQLGSAIEP